jgi:phenylacetic acid degradation operon negative regulatory protein
MKLTTSTEWIANFLKRDPPRSKSLVMTIFGDTIAPHGGTIWLGSLIDLLAPFGVNDRLLRTSVFRLAQEGWLVANRDGRRSSYSILPEAQARFERANRRIYAPLTAHWDGSWTLLLSASGSIDAPERAALRKELLWEGYAMIAPGIFGHPASDTRVLEELLARTGLQGKLFVCNATALPGVSSRPLQDLVGDGWDLSDVING